MKEKILLISLAMLLLGLTKARTNQRKHFIYYKDPRAMEERNEFVTYTTAAMIQINAPRYNCEIVETELAGGDRVRICVKGAKEDLDALFDHVNEAGKE